MRATDNALRFATALTGKFAEDTRPPQFAAVAGRVNDKIIVLDDQGRPASIHAFVDRTTGHVYKPAGKRPADGARYPDVDTAVAAADRYGSYLYAGAAPGVPGH